MVRHALALLMFGLVVTVSAMPRQAAVESIDTALNAKLRAEGMERSKVLWIEHYLTDLYGPRPTGSPNHVAAANWAMKTMASWGMTNTHLEPFTWRGIGWLPGRATGVITSPVKANLKFEAMPWSPSTPGTISGPVVQVIPPQNPTEAELTAFLAEMAPRVKGGIVMVGLPPNSPVNFNEPAKRTPDDQVRTRYAPPDPSAPARGRGGRGRGGGPGAAPPEGRLSTQQVSQRIAALLRDNPPALRLAASGTGRIAGVIVAQNAQDQTYDEASQISPGAILRNDDYGRISRILADGTPVSVEFNIANEYFPNGRTSYVTVGEIPGSDKADEVVMLGAHLDSWTSATGATDNAIGCAIMLEAVRILEAVGARPRRTIRVALWSGEEEGLLGSLAYVQQHFGMAENPKLEHAKLDAYWNIDDGTGRVRGASIFGPAAAAVVVAQFLKPFEDWGVYGASATSRRAVEDTDSTAFNQAGLPGISTQQDQIEYNSTTWHTNLDTYERIVPDDVMKNAVITASVVLHLANREQMIPRFAAAEMPALPAARGRGAGTGAGTAAAPADPHVYSAPRNRTLTIAAPGLLPAAPPPTAGGPPRELSTAALDAAPAHGKVVLKSDGSFVYTPVRGFTGIDAFTYTVSTGAAAGAPGTVTIAVR